MRPDACAAMSYASSSRPAALCGSARSRSGTSTCDSSQSIIATRSAVMRMLPGLGSPWTTHVERPVSRAHAARHRTTPSAGISLRSTLVPVPACRKPADDRQPGRCGQPRVTRCSWRSAPATRRQSASVSGDPPSTQVITTRPPAKCRPSLAGTGTGTAIPAPSRCRSRPVSHARSASLRWPRRPTARCPLTRTLHTSLTPTPPASGSTRTTSSPHCPSASHPTGHIFADGHEALHEITNPVLKGPLPSNAPAGEPRRGVLAAQIGRSGAGSNRPLLPSHLLFARRQRAGQPSASKTARGSR